MSQPVYYSDNRVQLTGESAMFDGKEYNLAHFTRASLNRQGQVAQMSGGTVLALLYLLWFIVRLMLRVSPNPIISLAVSFGIAALARQVRAELKEKIRPQYTYAIQLHGPSGTPQVFTSPDSAYLKKIVAVINHVVEGRVTEGQREALKEKKWRRRHRGSGGRSSPGRGSGRRQAWHLEGKPH
jgi:hypothetical protein